MSAALVAPRFTLASRSSLEHKAQLQVFGRSPVVEERPSGLIPPIPETVADTGLPVSLIDILLLKTLHFRSALRGKDIAGEIRLPFRLIEGLLGSLVRSQLIEMKRSRGGAADADEFELTETGRSQVREHLRVNQYAGPAPVPLEQYTRVVLSQRRPAGWLTRKKLAEACSHLVLTPGILAQAGPAVSSGGSLLLHGLPGNGKTCFAEALAGLKDAPIFAPYAIEHQGMIIQVFDPGYHEIVEDADAGAFDGRWFQCKRPFIMSGGELSLESLDLGYNETTKVYRAPVQLKANNGIYLMDDFGRQRTPAVDLLNRWSLPMERGVDYLTFRDGGKMTVPFEAFLIFSTNLRPDELGGEAVLRRIHHKILMRNPMPEEFEQIFLNFCQSQGLGADITLVARFMHRHYWRTGKPYRRCEPGEVISRAIDIIRFESLPHELTDELLDRAMECCFAAEEQEALF